MGPAGPYQHTSGKPESYVKQRCRGRIRTLKHMESSASMDTCLERSEKLTLVGDVDTLALCQGLLREMADQIGGNAAKLAERGEEGGNCCRGCSSRKNES